MLSIDRLGWFTECRTAVKLRVPAHGSKPIRSRLAKGKVRDGEVRVIGAAAAPAMPPIFVVRERLELAHRADVLACSDRYA